MSSGNTKRLKPTPYRDGQNVIRDSASGRIVYMSPEAKDVTRLIKDLVKWIESEKEDNPIPILAGIAHYQFAIIHPYWDGNGRTARLLTTLILHINGYDMKGIYSLEEYYAKDLMSYYNAINIGESNYYMGLEDEDITSWVKYFCRGMQMSFENVRKNIESQIKDTKTEDKSKLLYELDVKQKKAIGLFIKQKYITSKDVALILGISIRTANNVCKEWLEKDFVKATSESKKGRKYELEKKWFSLLKPDN